jgi:hypothetical protein
MSDPIIDISPVVLQLETAAAQTSLEYSGFGFVEPCEGGFRIYDAVILDVGTTGTTEIPARKILPLIERQDAKNMKLWFHKHPLGNGIPGPHNWSGVDYASRTKTPLGSTPELVQWSLAMVRTPKGWVGALDDHLNGKQMHLQVLPDLSPTITLMDGLISEQHVSNKWIAMDCPKCPAGILERTELGLECDRCDYIEYLSDDPVFDYWGLKQDWEFLRPLDRDHCLFPIENNSAPTLVGMGEGKPRPRFNLAELGNLLFKGGKK